MKTSWVSARIRPRSRRGGSALSLGAAVCLLALAGCSSPGTTASTPSASTPSFRSSACDGSHLSGTLNSGGGGAAGSTLPDVVITNTSSTSCTMTGWPIVALVASDGGAPIGASSQRNTSVVHPTVTLAPKQTALIPLRITDALNYPPDTCKPTPAAGVEITPPGTAKPFFVALKGETACANASIRLITASAVIPSQ